MDRTDYPLGFSECDHSLGICWFYPAYRGIWTGERPRRLFHIDTRAWTRVLGGSEYDEASGISVANDGSIFITGFTDTNLDGQTNNGSKDAFLAKYNSNGSKAWTKLLGGPNWDVAKGVSTAWDGSVYITGVTLSSLDNQTNNGWTYAEDAGDAFLTKYNSNGSKSWTRLLGGTGREIANGVSTASDGSIYITGVANSAYDDETNTYSLFDGQAISGGADAFLAKYNSDGSKAWTKLLGEIAYGVSTASDGSVYIAGVTDDILDDQSNGGDKAIFLAKYNSSGSKAWEKLVRFTEFYPPYTIGITTSGNGSIFIAAQEFLYKYNSDGSRAWTSLLDDNPPFNGISSSGVSTASDGSIYVTGKVITGRWSYIGGGYDQPTIVTSSSDGYITKVNSNGSKVWTKLLGDAYGGSSASGIATTSDGSIYIAGEAAKDALLVKYNFDESYTITPSSTSINEATTLTNTISTTNVSSGKILYYALSGAGITAADFSSGTLSGSVTIGSDGVFTFAHALKSDLTTEGAETLDIKLFTDSKRTAQVGTTASVIINDSSMSPLKSIFTGTIGVDAITGNSANNMIAGLGGKDTLAGLVGLDSFKYALNHSLLSGYDHITDFAIGMDKLDGPKVVSKVNLKELERVSALNQKRIAAVLTSENFKANGAATFLLGPGTTVRTFLVLNDKKAGFSSATDAIIEITGFTGNLTDLAII